MLQLFSLLAAVGRQGKWVLPAGLLAALLLPQLAKPLQSVIGPMITVLLVISFLQVDIRPRVLFADLHQSVIAVALFQIVLPLLVLYLLRLCNVPVHWQVPVALVGAAAPIMGGPSIVMMLGGSGALSMRLLIIGTLLLPITSFPVFWVMGLLPDTQAVIFNAIKLGALIAVAWFAAHAIQKLLPAIAEPVHRDKLNGLAALFLAVVVIGLMAAIHDFWDRPGILFFTLLLATLVNVVYQVLGVLMFRLFKTSTEDTDGRRIAFGVMNGNRAVAVFLAVLPVFVYKPYLLFIACYQIPMYLTPLLGDKLYSLRAKT